MAEHKIAILNHIASVEGGAELVCNNPTDTIRFEFDEEWVGKDAKTARFTWEGNKIDVPFSGNVVEVPEIFHTNYVYVGVFTDDITSTPVKVKCRYSIKCLGGKVVVPPDDVYNRIIALINAGVNANDGVGVSTAVIDANGHLIVTLTTGKTIDCGIAKGNDGAGIEEYDAMASDIADLKNYAARPFETAGSMVQLDNFEGMPMNAVTHIEPVQAGSGDPSPDNVRPITGYAGAKLTKCGKNLLNRSDLADALQVTQPGTTDAIMDGYGWRKDVAVGSTAEIGRTISLSCLRPGVTYTLSFVAWCSGSGVFYVDCYPDSLPETKINITATPTRYTWTFTSDNPEMSGAVIRVWGNNNGNDTWTVRVVDIHLEIGSTAESFDPYQGETFSANFGQTVYGGTLDWNKGEMVVEWAAIDGGTRNWSVYNDGVQVFLADGNPTKIFGAFNIISSHYKTSKSALVSQMGDMEIKGSQSSNAIFIRDTRYTDTAAFKAAMNGVQICYQMQKPITIQLTPAQITALQGMNNIWCDAGETTVSGRKDILWLTHALLERIKTLETAIVSMGGNV